MVEVLPHSEANVETKHAAAAGVAPLPAPQVPRHNPQWSRRPCGWHWVASQRCEVDCACCLIAPTETTRPRPSHSHRYPIHRAFDRPGLRVPPLVRFARNQSRTQAGPESQTIRAICVPQRQVISEMWQKRKCRSETYRNFEALLAPRSIGMDAG